MKVKHVLSKLITLAVVAFLFFPVNSNAQTVDDKLQNGEKLTEEEALQVPYSQFKELQEDGLIDENVEYPESGNSSERNSIDLKDYGLYEKENGELASLPEDNEISPLTYDTTYPGSNVNVRIGDILVTNETSSYGLTGHAGIVISNNRVVHIQGSGHTVDRKGISNWFSDYPTTTVVRVQSLSKAQTAGRWAYNYERDHGDATYSVLTTLKSGLDPTYCSKIIYQAYYNSGAGVYRNFADHSIFAPYDILSTNNYRSGVNPLIAYERGGEIASWINNLPK